VALKDTVVYSVLAMKRAGFSLAGVLGDAFIAFMLACNRFLHRPTASSITFCDMLAHVSMMHCFKSLVTAAGVADNVQCTHVPASIHKFCS